MANQTHPLIGKIVHWLGQDDDYTLHRFVADLGNGLMLGQRVSPHTGEDLPTQSVIALAALAERDVAEIYENLDAHERDMLCEDCQKKEKPVRLVPPRLNH